MVTSCANKPVKILGDAYLTKYDESAKLEHSTLIALDTTAADLPVININPEKKYQSMDGFGYTLTGGSAMLLHKMSKAARAKILQELFGTEKNDLGISYLRLSIGASDLDEAPFSYDDMPAGEIDPGLEHFSLAHDTLDVVPMLQEILAINPHIKILGSPWSPPVWMKDNGDTRGGSLLPQYHQAYADYFVKYIKAMQEEGIVIDAVTIQNEPLHPGNNPSLLMLSGQQGKFIKENLGPTFNKEGIETKIILYDHNADRPDYPISILNDAETAKYVDGSAFHLYGGSIDAIRGVHEAHPEKNLYFTEQWVGAPGDFAKEMSWHTENLIIGAPRNWCKTVLEWNLAADENQDPHTDRGGCDRCLGAITISGDEVTRNPAYYIIGQASRFVRPGSIRIASNNIKDLPNVAYQAPSGEVVAIVQNKNDREAYFKINQDGEEHVFSIPAKAVKTFVLR
ncbi:MAG: glucosylceramidase [Cytophagaceae bacterium]|nr:glucosylceramidase [Cytophagaceae bacterium]